MISKGSLKTIAYTLADVIYEKRCRSLDKYIMQCYDKAFEGEFISKELGTGLRISFMKIC